jgi:hypothetical protein
MHSILRPIYSPGWFLQDLDLNGVILMFVILLTKKDIKKPDECEKE